MGKVYQRFCHKDFLYSDTYGGKEPGLDSGTLEAKGKVSGYMTFEIPKENQPISLLYDDSKSVLFTSPAASAIPSVNQKP